MNRTDIQPEGAFMKREHTIQVEQNPVQRAPSAVLEKGAAVRQVDVSRVTQSLVALAPEGAEFAPKQQVMAEQFRVLRTRVKALRKDFQIRTMLITSALPGEGKTTVAANLAGTLSQVEGMRILLVDFDLRHPNLHTVFGLERGLRVPSALAGEVPWQQGVYRVNRRLDVLFGFHPLADPDLLLQGQRLSKLLEEIRAAYDVVILDSAPLLAVADTQSLVPLVDCGLFVVNADATPIHAAREALAMLQDKVAGCIVNRVGHLKSEGYYRASGYGYGYGYGQKSTEN